MSLSASQLRAVAARGNVLVVAGAGTGKTRTLVERCLDCLVRERPAVSLEELLVVTFTEAAAAEMRQRIRLRLEQEAQRHPEQSRWSEQLALFESAQIGTLHSFCLQLVRQHFYLLELDPQLSVLAEEEAHLLAEETLEGLLQKYYGGRRKAALAVQQLIQSQGRGWEQPIRRLVLRLHHYSQTLPDPAGWLQGQLELFGQEAPLQWRLWLGEALSGWKERWLAVLQKQPANALACSCASLLEGLPEKPSSQELSELLEGLAGAAGACPRGMKSDWLKPLKEFLAESRFLSSLCARPGQAEALAQDWDWVRPHMSCLVGLAQEFGAAFTQAKRELGRVDFHDLEQYALRLLWDVKTQQPTPLAEQWRSKLRFVFVDEYQDINAAQDQLLAALSRQAAQANRFLVGDVKQSIYRFRLANPSIFQHYARAWQAPPSQVIGLVENFRSRPELLEFFNSLFGSLFRAELGGVSYDKEARLQFGAAQERGAWKRGESGQACVELLLRVRGESGALEPAEEERAEALAEVLALEEAAKEARMVGLRLRELKSQGQSIWDEALGQARPLEWGDMAILLRSPANKAESYAKEFGRLKVPLEVARGGFYQSLEVSDLLSVLQLLDNPLQDVPVLAVLRSPLVGLSLNELASIRLSLSKGRFWSALVLWEKEQGLTPGQAPATYRKVAQFLERFARWRRLARQVSIGRCLEAVLAETHYSDWLLSQEGGAQRQANVQRLLSLAQQFDQFQRQGLYRFLRFVAAQQSAQAEPGVRPLSQENAVRLLSIHQSKGLEFALVVLADLSKPFNTADERAELILDELYGLCPSVKPPGMGKRYPSLPNWLARRRQHQELLGEELRLLYVGMTRARERLLLSASVSPNALEQLWSQPSAAEPMRLQAARSYSDWLGYWCGLEGGLKSGPQEASGPGRFLSWKSYSESQLLERPPGPEPSKPGGESGPSHPEGSLQSLRQRLAWSYPFAQATEQAAKTTVSLLRHQAQRDEESAPARFAGAEPGPESRPAAAPPPWGRASGAPLKGVASGSLVSGAEVGRAHHLFLQHVWLHQVGAVASLEQEAQRLEQAGLLEKQQVGLLDFEALGRFWSSALGRQLRAQGANLQRELAFTARFSPAELAQFTGQAVPEMAGEEFVVVQGVADLVVLLPQELWVVDFKSEPVPLQELAARVKSYEPQLRLYGQALKRIYRRPVTESWLYFLSLGQAVALRSDSEGL